MRTTLTLNHSELIQRLDDKKNELCFPTRSDLVTMILKKGLDFLDYYGYDEFIKIPINTKNWRNK